MKTKFKSFAIAIIVGALLGLLLIRPLMTSMHAFDDHEKIEIEGSLFSSANLEQTLQAMVFGIAICVFLNFWFQRFRVKSKNDNK